MTKSALSIVALCASMSAAIAALPDRICCEGEYDRHLQGVATDGNSIYWSFTTVIVKTDLAGKLLSRVDAPRHQGDLCVKDGVVYVAVNRGTFNQENAGVSEISSYDAKTLEHLKTWKIDMPHGAGGMTFVGDRFYVVGGLPATHERNYVYEYDGDFTLVKRHELATGFTLMGIQTAAFEDGRFLFGIYGCTGCPKGVITAPRDLSSFERWLDGGDVGIVKLDGDYFTGRTKKIDGDKGTINKGCLVRARNYPKTRYNPAACGGRGRLVVFFEGRDKTGWRDAGYSLKPNGYEPLCSGMPDSPFVKCKDADSLGEIPAVGIGGTRSYSAPDIVRALRRAAELDEVIALHVPGVSEDVVNDVVLDTVLSAVAAEAKRLKMEVRGL